MSDFKYLAKVILWFLSIYFLVIAPATAINIWLGFAVAAVCGVSMGLVITQEDDQ